MWLLSCFTVYVLNTLSKCEVRALNAACRHLNESLACIVICVAVCIIHKLKSIVSQSVVKFSWL